MRCTLTDAGDACRCVSDPEVVTHEKLPNAAAPIARPAFKPTARR